MQLRFLSKFVGYMVLLENCIFIGIFETESAITVENDYFIGRIQGPGTIMYAERHFYRKLLW